MIKAKGLCYTLMLLLLATFIIEPLQAAEEADSVDIIKRNNRGLVSLNTPIAPKGQWIVGTSASYSAHFNDNFSFAVVDGIVSNGYSVDVSPIIAYCIKPNLAIGGRFQYGRSLLMIDDAALNLGDNSGVDVGVNDYFALTQTFSIMAIMRQYIPIGRSPRFALFNEFRLETGINESKYAFDSPIVGTYAKGVNVSLSMMPGIVAFATNEVAIEVTAGILGIGFSHTEQTHNQVYSGTANSSDMSFKINLLSIGLGVSFYL